MDPAVAKARKVFGILEAPGQSDQLRRIRDTMGYAPDTDRYKYSDAFFRSLDAVEKESGGLLPSDAVVALAQLGLYDTELKKMSRELGAHMKPPVKDVLRMIAVKPKGKPQDWEYRDPITGEEISFEVAKRYYGPLEASYWQGFLRNLSSGQNTKGKPSKTPIDPRWFAAGVAAIQPHLGTQLSFKEVIGMGLSIAQQHIDTGLLSNNLGYIVGRSDVTNADAVGIAQMSAMMGQEISTDGQLKVWLGARFSKGKQKEAILASMDVDATLATLRKKYENNPQVTDFLDATQAELDAGRGFDYVDDIIGRIKTTGTSDGRFSLASRPAIDPVFEEVSAYVMSLAYASDSASALASKYMNSTDKAGTMKIHYSQVVQEMVDLTANAEQSEYDATHDWWSKLTRTVGSGFSNTWHKAQALSIRVQNEYAKLGNTVPWTMPQDQFEHIKQEDFAKQVEDGTLQYTDYLINEGGWAPWQAMAIDMAVTWYADPLMIGGKFIHAAKLSKFAVLGDGLKTAEFAVRTATSKRILQLGGEIWSHVHLNTVYDAVKGIGEERRAAQEFIELSKDAKGVVQYGVTQLKKGRGRLQGLGKEVAAGNVPVVHLGQRNFEQLYSETTRTLKKIKNPDSLAAQDLMKLKNKLDGKGVLKNPSSNPSTLWLEHLNGAEGQASRAFFEVDQLIKQRWAGQALPDEFQDYVWRYVQEYAPTRSKELLQKDIDEMYGVLYGLKTADDTAAGQFLREMADKEVKLQPPAAKMPRGMAEARMAEHDALIANDMLNEMASGFGKGASAGRDMHYALTFKNTGFLRKWGIRSGFEDTGFAKGWSALPQKYSGPWLERGKDLPMQVGRYLSRSRVFEKGEMAVMRREAMRIIHPDNPNVVEDFRKFSKSLQEEMIRRVGKQVGLNDNLSEGIMADIMQRLSEETDTMFQTTAPEIRKMLETQDLKKVFVVDPIEVRSRLRASRNIIEDVLAGVRQRMGKEGVATTDALLKGATWDSKGKKIIFGEGIHSVPMRTTLSNMTKGMMGDYWLKYWKPLVVVSPRYVLRLVGIEETSRFIADVGILGRLQASKTWALAANKLGIERDSVSFVMDAMKTQEVTDDIAKAGFRNVQEAIDVHGRVGLTGALPDVRYDKLSKQTRDVLDSSINYSTTNEAFDLSNSIFKEQKFDKVDVPLSKPSYELASDGTGSFRLNVQNPATARDIAAVAKEKGWKSLKDISDADLVEALSDRGFDAITEGNRVRPFSEVQILNGSEDSFVMKLELPRPGEMIDDIAATKGVGQSEFFESLSRQYQLSQKQIGDAKRAWGLLLPEDKGYWPSYANNLNNQYGRSTPARKILQGIYTGESQDDITRMMVDWFQSTDGRVYGERLGIFENAKGKIRNPDKVFQQVEARVGEVWKDTLGGNADIAKAALDHKVTESWLKSNFPNVQFPEIHGINVDKLNDVAKWKVAHKPWNWVYTHIMEIPTSKFVRQPYFKTWYGKMKKSLLTAEIAKNGTVTDEALRAIDGEARRFAAARVKDVMFDFSESNRFSEMMRFIAPFMMPFTEQYSVWGRLVMDNPAIAAYYSKVYRAAKGSGVITTDELTGEEQIKLPFVDILLGTAFPEGTQAHGWSVVGNIASLNFFTQNMLELPGGMPIPMPGLSPQATWVMQQVVESDLFPKSMKLKTLDWVNQYGKMEPWDALPAWSKDWLTAAGVIDSDVKSSIEKEFLKTYYANGLTPQAVIDNGWANDMAGARKYLADKAENDATQLLFYRGVARTILPIAPQFEPPIENYINEYRDLLQDHDPIEAKKIFEKMNPQLDGMSLQALVEADTFWTGLQGTGTMAEAGPVALPANRLTMMLMDNPAFQVEMKNNPLFAFMFLPDEVWDAEFDTQSYYEQLDRGWRANKDPYKFMDDIESARYAEARYMETGWYYDAKQRLLNNNPDITSSSATMRFLEAEYQQRLADLNTLYPGAQQRYNTQNSLGVNPQQLDAIRSQVLNNPAVLATDMGRATHQFVNGVDKIMAKMQDRGLETLDSYEAYDLKQEAYDLKDRVMLEHPQSVRVMDMLFDGYFSQDYIEQAASLKKEKFLEKVGNDPTFWDTMMKYDQQWGKSFRLANEALDDAQAAPHWLKLRKLSMSDFRQRGFSAQVTRWKYFLTDTQKDSETMSARLRPYVYLSEFDKRSILNISTSAAAEKMWTRIGEMDVRIAKIRDRNPEADTQALYAERDKLIKQLSGSSSLFRKQVAQANTWGFSFFHDNPWLNGNDRSSEAWNVLVKGTVENFQTIADNRKMTGIHDFDSSNKVIYSNMRNVLQEKVQEGFQLSAKFKREWTYAEREYGGDLLEYFLPEWYFPLGG